VAHRQWCDRECDSPRDQSSPEGSGDLLAPHERGGGLATPRVLQGGEMEEARESSSYVDPRRCCMRPMKSERSRIEPIALLVGHGDVSGLQKFVGAASWADDDVMAEAQALFADELAPAAAGSPVGVVGVIDESAFT